MSPLTPLPCLAEEAHLCTHELAYPETAPDLESTQPRAPPSPAPTLLAPLSGPSRHLQAAHRPSHRVHMLALQRPEEGLAAHQPLPLLRPATPCSATASAHKHAAESQTL